MHSQTSFQRIVVVGCCGAGKSTFSAALARRLCLPYVERDRLGDLGSEAYRTAVDRMLTQEEWVLDGPPYYVDGLVYPAAQIVIWLDYGKTLVLWRAIRRSLRRTFCPPESEESRWWRFRQWSAPGGPCWAWQTYSQRKQEFAALSRRPELASVQVVRFGCPAEARAWLAGLGRSADE